MTGSAKKQNNQLLLFAVIVLRLLPLWKINTGEDKFLSERHSIFPFIIVLTNNECLPNAISVSGW